MNPPTPGPSKTLDPDEETGVWTSIEDDTGGGRSLTGHSWLYMQASPGQAGKILRCVFGFEAGHATDPYGPCFTFRQADSFAAASWRARGCGFDSSTHSHTESPRNGFTPYKTPSAYAAAATLCPLACQKACERDLRGEDAGSRHDRAALFRRLTCLAALCAASDACAAEQHEFADSFLQAPGATDQAPDSLHYCQKACLELLAGLSFPNHEPGQTELASKLPSCIQALLQHSSPDSLAPHAFAEACAARLAQAAGPAGQENLAPFLSRGLRKAPAAAAALAQAALRAGFPAVAGLCEQALIETLCSPPNANKPALKI